MVCGEQMNLQSDMPPGFGKAVLCPVASANHSSEQKQEVGIVMGRAPGVRGGVQVYLLNGRDPVNRRVLKPMSMFPYIINHMNTLAADTVEIRKNKEDNQYVDFGADSFHYSETIGMEDQWDGAGIDDYYRGQRAEERFMPQLSQTMVDIDYSVGPETVALPRQQSLEVPTVLAPTVRDVVEVEHHHAEPTVTTTPQTKTTQKSRKKFEDRPVEIMEGPRSSRRNVDYSKLDSKGTTGVNVADGEEDIGRVYQMTLMRALASEHADAAREAAKKELKQLIDLKTWIYLKKPTEASASVHTKETPCSMFLKPKFDARGEFTLWKARLVDGGHMTDPLRYEPMEKTAPTTTLEIVLTLLAIAAAKKYEVESFDVPGAYLNANLKPGRFHKMRISKRIVKLLVEVDPSARPFVQEDGTVLVEIRKSLYGLPEAAQLWYEYLKGALRDGGYTQCPYDPCLFMRSKAKGLEVSIIAIYVDDCLHIHKGEGIRRELYQSLRNHKLDGLKIEKLTNKTPISFLGLNILRKSPNLLFVNQKGYLENILAEFEDDYSDLRDQPNPCNDDVFRPEYSGEDLEPTNTTEYLSKLMKIRYLVRTRPDIELACSAYCTRSKNPSKGDAKGLNKLLKYLDGTQNYGLYIRETDLQVVCYFDAGFAIHLDRKSHSGHYIAFGDKTCRIAVHWRSIKQKIVATSSTEAELVAMYEGLDFVIWFKRVLEFLHQPQNTIRVFQDNTSTISMAFFGRGSSASNTRHIDIKYFFTKQFVDDKTIVLEHLPRENMMADFFASPRTGKSFRKMRDVMMSGI
jgi:hypothetical protein